MSSASSEDAMTRGFAFGRLAIRITETQIVPPEVACSVYNFFASHIMIWHRPLLETQRYFLAAINKGLETYDLSWTSIAVIDRAVFGLFAGESLDLVQAKLEEAAPLIRKKRQEVGKYWLAMPMHLVRNLRGSDQSNDVGSEITDPSDVLEAAKSTQSHTHLFAYHCYQLILAVFNGNKRAGFTAAKMCETYLPSAKGSFLSAMYTFYVAVLMSENMSSLMQAELTLLRAKMDIIKLWAKTSSSTFGHKYQFLKVMTSKMDNDLHTLDAFDEAIYNAVQNGFIQDAALYAERCSQWLAKSSPKRSAQYLNFARRQYDFWGAGAKSSEISNNLPPSTALRGFGINFSLALLTVAILPSPTNELVNPFFRKSLDDNGAPNSYNSFQSPISSRDLRHTSFGESVIRPSQRDSTAMSVHSSSTDDSRRRNSALTNNSAPRDSDISSELDLQSVMRASLAIQEGPQVKNIILKLVHIIMQTAGANYGCIMLRGHRMERKSLHVEVIGNGSKVSLVDHKPLHTQGDVVPVRLCE
jgi:hypothetical protein